VVPAQKDMLKIDMAAELASAFASTTVVHNLVIIEVVALMVLTLTHANVNLVTLEGTVR